VNHDVPWPLNMETIILTKGNGSLISQTQVHSPYSPLFADRMSDTNSNEQETRVRLGAMCIIFIVSLFGAFLLLVARFLVILMTAK
jgi:hypothetical protein